MKLITAGESHGRCLVGTIEGLPSGAAIDIDKVNFELARRQKGYGRGGRMRIETDTATVVSGMRGKITLGSPLAFIIENRDYEKWADGMDTVNGNAALYPLTAVRPGHADLSGIKKYRFDDARNVLERASARETASRTAAGAICRQVLFEIGVEITSSVISIGGAASVEAQKSEIDSARSDGDTLGGLVEVRVKNMPIGVGSYVHYDRKLDGILSLHLMSIQSAKAVEFGLGTGFANIRGSLAHDEIFKSGRVSNNAGGIEGGMSNGEDIVARVTFKPIPTLMRGLNTIDVKSNEAAKAASERSDVCAVEAAAVVAENVTAFAILNEVLCTFGGDNMTELIQRVNIRRGI